MDAQVENKPPSPGPRTKPRRKNSVKCTLKTKAGPWGVPAVKKKPPGGVAYIINPDVYTEKAENENNELNSTVGARQKTVVQMGLGSAQKTMRMLNEYGVSVVTSKSHSGSVSITSHKPAVPNKPKIAPRPAPPSDRRGNNDSTTAASQGRVPKLKIPGFEVKKVTTSYKPFKPTPLLNISSPKGLPRVPEKTVLTEKTSAVEGSNSIKNREQKSSLHVADMAAKFGGTKPLEGSTVTAKFSGVKPKLVSKPTFGGSVSPSNRSPTNLARNSGGKSPNLCDINATSQSPDFHFPPGAKSKENEDVKNDLSAKMVVEGEKIEAKSNIMDLKLTSIKNKQSIDIKKKKVPTATLR